jgi:hypothetical protein
MLDAEAVEQPVRVGKITSEEAVGDRTVSHDTELAARNHRPLAGNARMSANCVKMQLANGQTVKLPIETNKAALFCPYPIQSGYSISQRSEISLTSAQTGGFYLKRWVH